MAGRQGKVAHKHSKSVQKLGCWVERSQRARGEEEGMGVKKGSMPGGKPEGGQQRDPGEAGGEAAPQCEASS